MAVTSVQRHYSTRCHGLRDIIIRMPLLLANRNDIYRTLDGNLQFLFPNRGGVEQRGRSPDLGATSGSRHPSQAAGRTP